MKPICMLMFALAATPLLASEPGDSSSAQVDEAKVERCASMQAMMKDMTPEQMQAHKKMMQEKGTAPMAGCPMAKDRNQDAHAAVGTVTAVDLAAGKVTIAHEPVASLKWPAMSMNFEVEDEAILGALRAGDRLRFSFVQDGRRYVITAVDESGSPR